MQTDLKSSTDSPLKQFILSHSTMHFPEYSIIIIIIVFLQKVVQWFS